MGVGAARKSNSETIGGKLNLFEKEMTGFRKSGPEGISEQTGL